MPERHPQPRDAEQRRMATPAMGFVGLRAQQHASAGQAEFTASIDAAGVEIDSERQIARRSGRILRLGWAEFRLLELLMCYRGVVFYREQLVAIVWGTDATIDFRTVDQNIARLRRALTLGSAPDPIRSIRGKGYMFAKSADGDYDRWRRLGPTKLRLRR